MAVIEHTRTKTLPINNSPHSSSCKPAFLLWPYLFNNSSCFRKSVKLQGEKMFLLLLRGSRDEVKWEGGYWSVKAPLYCMLGNDHITVGHELIMSDD